VHVYQTRHERLAVTSITLAPLGTASLSAGPTAVMPVIRDDQSTGAPITCAPCIVMMRPFVKASIPVIGAVDRNMQGPRRIRLWCARCGREASRQIGLVQIRSY